MPTQIFTGIFQQTPNEKQVYSRVVKVYVGKFTTLHFAMNSNNNNKEVHAHWIYPSQHKVEASTKDGAEMFNTKQWDRWETFDKIIFMCFSFIIRLFIKVFLVKTKEQIMSTT